ncbi:Coiled-coil domain-containing protein 130 homolog [Caenorhabditis elegans]|uniref:Coiled-coil domain-containing protein 130 homolog n=1 Tax=Caenorhabditis elegans TaxID=6239 RepID=CC130_CAEEL|nr:Coiled-coil domain-containing protein 130 homolog [Caenorhabditis elegans]Q09651.1 RecName: Full=Coiled-coil domain-containing protein 130 homolog [Caenorhabditis elegans]CAA87435.1 Coiled-coil domain-containing protein 130 homolog [Caenorhabditis elegans]|eukprot:NP_496077.1 Coiled-coil domain-containing protein 130 homolog [Caenorhabditis elegans]
MGERKGQNFYYPPDFNYKTHKSLNGYHGTHALRERAKKIDQGILVIRFEMPFNIWCLGCHNHVGMGVRYNAEKKKIGMYYTTPLHEFRMKCHLCDNYYVIRTDPKNFDYELVEGCSRQELRFDPTDIAQIGAVDRGFTQKLAADAMFKKEHEAEDKDKAATEEGRVDKLEWIQERMRDDFTANSFLRAQFRNEKKSLNETRARDANLRDKLSIGTTQLLPETEEDRRIASMMTRYRDTKTHDDHLESSRDRIESRRIFRRPEETDTPSTSSGSSGGAVPSASERLKATMKAERDKRINASFSTAGTSSATQKLLGIKRKSASSLGVQIKKAAPENSSLQDEEPAVEKPNISNPISLIAQEYGNSSDDSD